MTVGELERLLSTLPDDTVVLIKGMHIEYVSKNGSRSMPCLARRRNCLDCGMHTVSEYEERDVPASIDLGSTIYAKGICAPPGPVKLYGRWPRASRQAMAEGAS